jgi:O-antigen/teichoic acid export membrane protein
MALDYWGDVKRIFRRTIRILSWKEIKRLLNDPFYSNSAYLMLSFLVASGIGLLFWIAAASFYTQSEVGIATAIISLSGLVVIISRLGFDQALIRFIPKGDKSKIFSTTVIVTTGFALLIGAILVGTIGLWSPSLAMSGYIAILFLALAVLQSIFMMMDNTFVALRKAQLSFVDSLIMGSRLILLLPLLALGFVGILSSYILATAISILVCTYLLYRLGIRLRRIDWSFLRRSFKFSAGNYVYAILTNFPYNVIPILILSYLGAESTASYYIAASICAIASLIPRAFNTSLFVEGSHGVELKKTVIKSLTASIILLIPVIVLIYIGGSFILGLLGEGYTTEGLELLKLLLISSLVVIPYATYSIILNIHKNVRMLIILGLINCVSLSLLSYLLMHIYGLAGVGYAWILASLISSAIAIIVARRNLSG